MGGRRWRGVLVSSHDPSHLLIAPSSCPYQAGLNLMVLLVPHHTMVVSFSGIFETPGASHGERRDMARSSQVHGKMGKATNTISTLKVTAAGLFLMLGNQLRSLVSIKVVQLDDQLGQQEGSRMLVCEVVPKGSPRSCECFQVLDA